MDKLAIALIILGTLVDGAFESTGGASVSVDVVGELVRVNLLDFGNSRSDLGLVSSTATVLELHGVRCICFDDVFRHLIDLSLV